MDTKIKGDIAEYSVIVKALKFGWSVLKPVGDRLSYDLVFDVCGKFIKIQVKSAWYDVEQENYLVDVRRTKTNRRVMKRELYKLGDFDFAIAYIQDLDVFYVFPFEAFTKYKGGISLVEVNGRQREASSKKFREAWNLISLPKFEIETENLLKI